MQYHRAGMIASGMILVVAVCVGAAAQDAPSTRPAVVAVDPRVEKILDRLERRVVHDLRAKVKWQLEYAVEEGEGQRKFGKLWYRDAEPVPQFKVEFEKKVVDRRLRELDEQHLFDGTWYVEKNAQTKTVSRRQVRREGEQGNPYKLGEGPFPLPFGQKKADILREFEVKRVDLKANDPEKTDRLQLTPRPGTRTGESYGAIDFWVAQEGPLAGLPVKVRAAKRDGTGMINSYITVTFDDVQLNDGFSMSVFKIETPAGFQELVEPLAGPATSGSETKEAP